MLVQWLTKKSINGAFHYAAAMQDINQFSISGWLLLHTVSVHGGINTRRDGGLAPKATFNGRLRRPVS